MANRLATVIGISWTAGREYTQVDALCAPAFGDRYQRIRIITEQKGLSETVFVFDGNTTITLTDGYKGFRDAPGLLEIHGDECEPLFPLILQDYTIRLCERLRANTEIKEMFDDFLVNFKE